MTTAGWIMMIVSIGLVVWLNYYCLSRVLRTPRSEKHMRAPLDIDTHDKNT